MNELGGVFAATKSSSDAFLGTAFFVLVLLVAVTVAAVGIKVEMDRRRRYAQLLAVVDADPCNWATVFSGRQMPSRPTGPLVYRVGTGPMNNMVLAFDDQLIVCRSLGQNTSCTVVERPQPRVSFHRKRWMDKTDRLGIGGTTLISMNVAGVASELDRLGWPLVELPKSRTSVSSAGSWPKPRPAPPAGATVVPPAPRYVPPIPTSLVSTPRGIPPGAARWTPGRSSVPAHARGPSNLPVPPNVGGPPRSATSEATHDIEFGTDHLGAAIDDWMTAEDLDDIE